MGITHWSPLTRYVKRVWSWKIRSLTVGLKSGVWTKIWDIKKKDEYNESHILDFTIAKVHQHATGGGGNALNGIEKSR